jgi:hypothetical protein
VILPATTSSDQALLAALTVGVLIVDAGPAGLHGGYYVGFRGLSIAHRLRSMPARVATRAIRAQQRLPGSWNPSQPDTRELFAATGRQGGSRKVSDSLSGSASVVNYIRKLPEK